MLKVVINKCVFLVVQMKHHPNLDANLRDICIGTSAAPTYLPAHYFETQDSDGCVRPFNLIDGGIAANNPVHILELFVLINSLHEINDYQVLLLIHLLTDIHNESNFRL